MPNKLFDRITRLTDRLSRPEAQAYRLALALILLLGVILRLLGVYWGQAYHHFMVNDEVQAYEYARAWLAGEPWALYLAQPVFNGGQLPGPLWTLLGVALLKLGGNSAEGAMYVLALLNSTVVYFVYLLARRMLSPGLVLFTALLYASAPWAIYYSFGLYNPVVLDLLGVLLLLALWQVQQHDHSRQVFWVALLAASIPQFHMIAVFFIPALLLVLYAMPARLNRGWLLAGIGAGLLLYLPYLYGDYLNDWQNLKAVMSGGTERGYSPSVLKIISAPVTVLSSVPAGWTGDSFAAVKAFADAKFGFAAILIVVGVWTLVHGFVYLGSFVRRVGREMHRQGYSLRRLFRAAPVLAFCGIVIGVPLLLFLLTGHNFSTRYAIILFPLLFLLPALYLQAVTSQAGLRYWRVSLGLIVLFNVYMVGAYFHYQAERFERAEEVMPSFRLLDQVYQVVRDDAGTARVDIRLGEAAADLPHFENKLLYIVPQYYQIQQRYVAPPPADAPVEHYLVEPAGAPVTGRVVYARHGMLVQRMGE